MFNPTATLASFNDTVRLCEECNANRYSLSPTRLDADFEQIRLTALHDVMHHRSHQNEY